MHFVFLFRKRESIELPEFGRYATGILFLDQCSHEQVEAAFEKLAEECNLRVRLLGVRDSRHCTAAAPIASVLQRSCTVLTKFPIQR